MLKKLILMIFVILMVLSFSACSRDPVPVTSTTPSHERQPAENPSPSQLRSPEDAVLGFFDACIENNMEKAIGYVAYGEELLNWFIRSGIASSRDDALASLGEPFRAEAGHDISLATVSSTEILGLQRDDYLRVLVEDPESNPVDQIMANTYIRLSYEVSRVYEVNISVTLDGKRNERVQYAVLLDDEWYYDIYTSFLNVNLTANLIPDLIDPYPVTDDSPSVTSATMPDLINEDCSDARSLLRELGLRLEIVIQPVTSHVERPLVIETIPAAGSTIIRGDTIIIRYSEGPDYREVTIPTDMVGRSQVELEAKLEVLGITPDIYYFPNSANKGTVLYIEKAGQLIEVPATIVVHISSGS